MIHGATRGLMALALLGCASDPSVRGGPAASSDAGGTTTSPRGSDASRSPDPLPDPGAQPSCETVEITAAEVTPNVLLVLDRSGSMEGHWRPAVNAVHSATRMFEDRMRFGAAVFPARGSVNQCTWGGACPAGEIVVEPALGTSEAIHDRLGRLSVSGATPTARTLRRMREHLQTLEGQSYVVLVTDGAPNCNRDTARPGCSQCTALSGTTCRECDLQCLDRSAIDEVAALAAAGFPTWVVGYALSSEFRDVLNAMARAGGTGRDTFIPVRDRETLQMELAAIASSVVSCEYGLDQPVGDPAFVRVTIDGETILHESAATDGRHWSLSGDRTVVLNGEACRLLRDGARHTIHIQRECEPVLI